MLELFLDYYDAVQGDLYPNVQIYINPLGRSSGRMLCRGIPLPIKIFGEEIVFSRWNSVEGSPRQVRRTTFSYSSLFGDDDISKVVCN
jgi:hypothetical protein